ncbi:2-phosphosulfolactate phosphatase [Entamoeba marina]
MTTTTTSIVISPSHHTEAKGVCVVIDVLRASSVEAHLFKCKASQIIPQSDIDDSLAMKRNNADIVLIGERQGIKYDGFDFGNSPIELLKNQSFIEGKICVHNTQQGTQAISKCRENPNVTDIYMCGVNNCKATIDHLLQLNTSHITFVASGDEIKCREDMFMKDIISDVKTTSGSKFFKNLPQFPEADFHECFKEDSINVVMKLQGEIIQSI